MIREETENFETIAKKLVSKAFEAGSMDNISVVVVSLKNNSVEPIHSSSQMNNNRLLPSNKNDRFQNFAKESNESRDDEDDVEN
jgi:serine/threonine protein phosphatase PrpC